MNDRYRHIAIGVVVGVFVTPLLGGGVTGYLDGGDVRRGLGSGAVVGALTGVVVSGAWTVLYYYSTVQPVTQIRQEGMGMPGVDEFLFQMAVVAVLLFAGSVLFGLVGGGIGSYVADVQRSRAGPAVND